MISKKDQIGRIIKQLTATEKAYFKKFAFKSGSLKNNVTILFDLVDDEIKKEGENFDIESVKKQFIKKSKSNFIKTKSRLLDLVLNSLREYDSNQSFISEIFSWIEISESLAKRNLFYDAYNILQKALSSSIEIEEPEIELYILNKLALLNTYINKYVISNLNNEKNHNNLSLLKIENIKEKYESDTATLKVLHFQKVFGVPKNSDELEEFKKLLNNKYFNSDKRANFHTSEIDRTIAKNGLNFMQGKTDKVIEESQNLLESLPENKKLIKKITGRIFSLYDSFLQACLLSFNFSLYEKYYPQFILIEATSVREKFLKKSIDLFVSSLYSVLNDKAEHIPQLALKFNEIESEDFVPNYRKISIAYYLLFGNFLFEKYDEAQDYIIWLRNHQHYGIRADVESAYLTIELIILWEKNEIDLLEYKLRAYKEYLKKKEKSSKIEYEFYKLIKEVINKVDNSNQKNIFEEYNKLMFTILAEDTSSVSINSAIDIISWTQSKYKKEDFKTLYYINNGINKIKSKG